MMATLKKRSCHFKTFLLMQKALNFFVCFGTNETSSLLLPSNTEKGHVFVFTKKQSRRNCKTQYWSHGPIKEKKITFFPRLEGTKNLQPISKRVSEHITGRLGKSSESRSVKLCVCARTHTFCLCMLDRLIEQRVERAASGRWRRINRLERIRPSWQGRLVHACQKEFGVAKKEDINRES